jgi:hypothetical protein
VDEGNTGMGLDKLKEQREYKDLTPKQQVFVDNYVTNGCDKFKAARAAYTCKADKNADILSYRVLAHPGVTFVIGLYFGNDPAQMFTDYLWHMICKRRITRDQLTAYMLYADIRGLRTHPKNQDNVFTRLRTQQRKAGEGHTREEQQEDLPEETQEDFLDEF